MRNCVGQLVFVTVLPAMCAGQTTSHLTEAVALSRRLAAAPKPGDIGRDAIVPDAVPSLVSEFKQEMRQWLSDRLAAAPPTDLRTLRSELEGEIKRAGLLMTDDGHDANPYGTIWGIRLSSAPGDSNLMQLIISYDAFCAPDDSVLFFEKKSGMWQLAMSFDNTDLERPWGDRAVLYSSISPRDSRGRYYALVVRTRSYCPGSGSTWNNVNFHVLRPSSNPASPIVLLSKEAGYHEQQDFRADLQADGFTLDFVGGAESANPFRVFRYVVTGNEVRRTDPLAANAYEFALEWVTVKWDEAKTWLESADLDRLHDWHDRLGKSLNLFTIGGETLKYCSADRKVIQIGFTGEDLEPPLPDLFVVVKESKDRVYRMLDVAIRELPGCFEPVTLPDRVLPESLNRANDN